MGIAISNKRGHSKAAARNRRHLRVRKRITGDAVRPRLVVSRSLRHVVAQVVDDTTGHTLASASTMEPDLRTDSGAKTATARTVGQRVAQRAQQAGVSTVVFDRGGNAYHGRVAAVADGAREAGLTF